MGKNLPEYVGFEKLAEDKEKIVYRRVLNPKNRKLSKKEKNQLEVQLPTVTLRLFDPIEFEKLQDIFDELVEIKKKEKSQKKSVDLSQIASFLMR